MKKENRKTNKADDLDTKHRYCDPGMCDHCIYLGEGDFICETHRVIVVADWTPTEEYMKCKQIRKRRENNNAR